MMQQMTKKMMVAMAIMAVSAQEAPECKKFSEIYGNGKNLVEKMWGGAFKYETKEEEAYTMWFFDKNNNPNDKTTQNLVGKGLISNVDKDLGVDKCYLAYYHKGGDQPINNADHPSQEPENFSECHPWAENSCCLSDTVSTVQKIKDGYGAEYWWDRCGPITPACERYFVMEACLYECDPNAGIYRKHKDSSKDANPFGDAAHPLHDGGDDTNGWELHGMPIKASFADSWYDACKNDYFCAADDGNFFSCAKAYKPVDQVAAETFLPGTCKGACDGFGKKVNGGGQAPCECNGECELKTPHTCCEDRKDYCVAKWVAKPFGSCEGSCGGASKTPKSDCWCDDLCVGNGDCCSDRDTACGTKAPERVGSCEGACGGKTLTEGGNCYCDKACSLSAHNDCCLDRDDKCTV